MTIAHHNERDGWTWYTDPVGRIVACGSNAAAVRGAVRGAGYQIEGETARQADRNCDTCGLAGLPGWSSYSLPECRECWPPVSYSLPECRECWPPVWPNWRAKV